MSHTHADFRLCRSGEDSRTYLIELYEAYVAAQHNDGYVPGSAASDIPRIRDSLDGGKLSGCTPSLFSHYRVALTYALPHQLARMHDRHHLSHHLLSTLVSENIESQNACMMGVCCINSCKDCLHGNIAQYSWNGRL